MASRSRYFWDRTYRVLDDGERIEGTWRHVFIRNGDTYFLTNLKIYSDGLIDCWGLVNIEGFREKVRSGWVATSISEGGKASAHHLADWLFTKPRIIDGHQLILEVEDTIAELQGASSSSERCRIALEAYLSNRTAENRALLRKAYLAIPEHLRRYVLGDQDMADWPIRVLIGELGEPLMPRFPPFDLKPITHEDIDRVLQYFESRKSEAERWRAETNDGDPDGPPAGSDDASLGESGTRFTKGGWVDVEGDGFLSNDVPIAITIKNMKYPSVTHAYWAMSTDDSAARQQIQMAANPRDAQTIGVRAPRRANWPAIRLAVMSDLIRLKFEQHVDLADRLIATGNVRIRAIGIPGTYWEGGSRGRNWLGRILEMVRSELWLQRVASTD